MLETPSLTFSEGLLVKWCKTFQDSSLDPLSIGRPEVCYTLKDLSPSTTPPSLVGQAPPYVRVYPSTRYPYRIYPVFSRHTVRSLLYPRFQGLPEPLVSTVLMVFILVGLGSPPRLDGSGETPRPILPPVGVPSSAVLKTPGTPKVGGYVWVRKTDFPSQDVYFVFVFTSTVGSGPPSLVFR